ncbi:putative UPF0481 protein At3g02645 [Andrographis paniculata]|uniref:putative UPF0481 protein At3g02645 n=1 Tax=Andrographis paniculata TaxID=175694 RepID=UPI0021E88C91|nr:putative UPF0481 protein At3g02645 [Andrographis paniculata]
MYSCSSSSHPLLSHISNTIIDEHRWIIHIRQALDDDEDLDQESDDIPVSIFAAPKALVQISPESYAPQHLAIGPYHHWSPELYEMERYKLSAAKKLQRQRKGPRFHSLADHLARFEPRFRACYHKYLNFNGETLSWMMAIDACFLLDFLQIFDGKASATGQKSGHIAVLRDIVMLENQIPLLAMRKVLEFQLGSVDDDDELLYPMLIAFCKELSPFKPLQELPGVRQVTKRAHLLDLLYFMIVPEVEGSCGGIGIESPEPEKERDNERDERTSFQKVTSIIEGGAGAVRLIKRALISRPVKALMVLPLKILSNLPGIMILRQAEYLFFSREAGGEAEQENRNSDCNEGLNKPPLMEEIAIPSVTELFKAGVTFSVTDLGISGIKFDDKTAALHLPAVRLDVNTEVTMRNLVAYEVCASSGPLVFTRYTELMNGIIDVPEDAKILREQGIVSNHLKCDEDAANLWNGMSKSVKLTKVPFLDKAIEDVNSYYNGRWKVRIRGFVETHVSGSWKLPAFLAATIFLFCISLKAFCAVVRCTQRSGHLKN